VPNETLTDLTGNLTLASWIKTTNNHRVEAIFARYSADGKESGYILRTNAAGHIELRVGGKNMAAGAPVNLTDGGQLINDGQWHHVVAVITLKQNVSFYIDGALSSTLAANITAHPAGNNLLLGVNSWTDYGNYFTGVLDQTVIYNRALAASEIASLASGN
jgi:hypothetical protein